jgi:putative PIN family toxin of toxin-antitoxin system
MRVLLDSNILARAAKGGSGPAVELLRRLILPPHVFISSAFVLSELSRVLRYERLRRVHGLDEEGMDAYVQCLLAAALIVDPPSSAGVGVALDSDDNPVLAAAIHGQAEVLCTRDHHLRHPDVVDHCASKGIRVLTDLELLQELRQTDAARQP